MAVAEDLDRYEATLRAQGFRRIAGVDEVGRGALAGPLVAAAVVLPEGFDRAGLRDSKLLTAKQREEQCERIVGECAFVIRKIVRPRRFVGSHLGEADLILGLIAGIVITLVLWHASQIGLDSSTRRPT